MTRGTRVAAAAVAVVASCGLVVAGAGASTTGRADSSTIYASNTHASSTYVYSAGQGRDALLGSIAVTYKYKLLPTMLGTFHLKAKRVVEYTATGSLTGTATATLTIAPGGAVTVTNGKVSLKHGASSLAGHSFKGTFSGSGSTTTNQLVLHVTGTYK